MPDAYIGNFSLLFWHKILLLEVLSIIIALVLYHVYFLNSLLAMLTEFFPLIIPAVMNEILMTLKYYFSCNS